MSTRAAREPTASGVASLPEAAGISVQTLSLIADLGIVWGTCVVLQVALGAVGWWLSSAVALLPAWFWARYGRSPGMALWGLYLLPEADRPLTIGRGLVRLVLLFAFDCLLALAAAAWVWRIGQVVREWHGVHPVDETLRCRVVRYEIPPLPRTRVDRLLDTFSLFAGVRLTDVERDVEPRDLGRPD